MSVPEPRFSPANYAANPYEGRWRWWYSAISDWMIANPGEKLGECAIHLNKHHNTIAQIASTDMFKAFHSKRLEEFRQTHDHAISSKLTSVAEEGLDLILKVMQQKKEQIPLNTLVNLTSSSLEKLGYGPKAGPQVVVNSPQQHNTVIMAPISAAALNEARDALRQAELRKASVQLIESAERPILELETDQPMIEGRSDAPATHDT